MLCEKGFLAQATERTVIYWDGKSWKGNNLDWSRWGEESEVGDPS